MTKRDSWSGKKVPYLTNANTWYIGTYPGGHSIWRMSKKQIWKWKQRAKSINTVYTKLYGAKEVRNGK